MTCITIKTKETKANVEIFPPIALNGRSHISLVDIKIPEEVIKILLLRLDKSLLLAPMRRCLR